MTPRRSSRLLHKGETCKTFSPTSRALRKRPHQHDQPLASPIPRPIPLVKQTTTRKRRRREDANPGRTHKRQRTTAVEIPIEDKNGVVPSGDLHAIIEHTDSHPIIHWTITGQWPDDFLTMDTGSDSFKAPSRSESYTSLSKQGKVPKSDSPLSEGHLAEHGIFTDEVKGDMFVSEDSKKLCDDMFNTEFEDPLAFYRHRIDSFHLGPGKHAGNRKKVYDFVREVYKTFYPAHLKRIQDALKQMKDPRAQSMPASVDQSSTGQEGSTALSSEQTTSKTTPEFKKPDIPASKKRKGKQAQQEEWFREQIEAQERRYAEQEKRYAEQEKRYAEEKLLQEKRYAELERRYAEQERRYAEEKVQQARQMEMLQQVLNQVNRQ
ncbi:hypothetical protein DV735_g3256, partial [Chaetothyriales sp. CBS 134920]